MPKGQKTMKSRAGRSALFVLNNPIAAYWMMICYRSDALLGG
jgi:hypothetical protein